MPSPRLDELRKIGVPQYKNFIIRIDGQPKSGKTRLAFSVSAQHPPPGKISKANPVEITDTATLQFEPNSTLSLSEIGLNVTKVVDLSDPTISLGDMTDVRNALQSIGEDLRASGVKNLVIDTLSTLNRFLLKTIIEEGSFSGDMERIRAYGDVDKWHFSFFDALLRMRLNIIGLVHLQHFAPFGEDGGSTAAAAQMKVAAAKQIDKQTAGQAGGLRTDFVADMRPKPAGHWGRMSDAILVAKPERVQVRAGVKETKYQFITQATDDFSAGGRLGLPAVVPDNYLYPIIARVYGP